MTLSLQLRVLLTYHICWGYSLLTTTSVEGTLYLPHLLRVLFTYHYICWGYSLLTTTSVEGTLYLPLHLLRVLFAYHYICWGYSLLTTTSVHSSYIWVSLSFIFYLIYRIYFPDAGINCSCLLKANGIIF